MENKLQDGRIKFDHIYNWIQYNWTKHFNEKTDIVNLV